MASSFASAEPPGPFMEFQALQCRGPSATSATRLLDVSVESLLEDSWYNVQRISLGTQPHQARFHSARNAMVMFDRGSYVVGERQIDKLRYAAAHPSPIDVGIDVVPAHSELNAVAMNGSNVTSILVSFSEDLPAEIFGVNLPQESLRPSFNVGGGLLLPLAARLRGLCRGDTAAIDNLYVDNVLVLLVREVLLAQGSAPPQRPMGGLSSKARRIVRDFLHDNFEKKINMDLLARQIGVSRFYFARAFKASFGMPPHKYIINLRIHKAMELLENTDLSITEIALSVGFSSSSEFSRAFKLAMDCAPREFRLDRRMSGV